ncbi:oligosaccharide flippase family protein [Gracilibacillus oryzae]|uniref:Oligosaccharide flippase family protein n=1 Tax=Gracilibacillus oryzae TaxID=1672701 RepID=A0A7C8KPU0_9BACI|nr:oligosaccharide flippase family protein [Gracilibacillus oryzae]KAB8133668.1 oligosaccharide flippase family protein [Gracilibacillus oryzae]
MNRNNTLVQMISSVGTKFVVLFGSLVVSIITARVLGPEGKGVVTSIFVIPNLLVSLADLGIRQSTAYFIGKKIYEPKKIYSSIFTLWTLTSVLAVGFTVIYYYFFMVPKYDWLLLAIPLGAIPILLLNKYNEGVMLGLQKILAINVKQIINLMTQISAVILLLLVFNLDVYGAALSSLLAGIFAVIFSFIVLKSVIKIFSSVDLKITKDLYTKGILYALALFILNLNYKIDIVFLEYFVSSNDIGVYSVGVTLSELIWQIPSAMGMVLFSKSANSKTNAEAVSRSTRLLRMSWIPIIVCSMLFWWLSPFIINLLFGAAFSEATSIIRLLLPGIVAMVLFKLLNADLAGRGFPIFALKVYLLVLVINVILNLILIPVIGINGAAISSSISYTIGAILFTFAYIKHSSLKLLQLFILDNNDKHLIISFLKKIFRK